jgi:hypothetical protein
MTLFDPGCVIRPSFFSLGVGKRPSADVNGVSYPGVVAKKEGLSRPDRPHQRHNPEDLYRTL